jgi:hypothetical protein
LSKSTALCSPVVVERRRQLGVARYLSNQRLRSGLAVGQQMARDGFGTAARDSAGPEARRLAARLTALGFTDDLAGYLHDRYDRQLRPVLAIAREFGVGNARSSGCSTTPGCSAGRLVTRRPRVA